MREERRIVPPYRLRSDHNRIHPRALPADAFPRPRRGHPPRITPVVADLSVQRHGELHRDVRKSRRDMLRERRNQKSSLFKRRFHPAATIPFAFRRVGSTRQDTFDARAGQDAPRPSTVLRIRIAHGERHATDAGRRDRVRARAHAPRLRARLQRHVQRRSAHLFAAPRRVLDGGHFCMVPAAPLVPSFADDLAASDDHRAHGRIRPRVALAATGKLDCPPHVLHPEVRLRLDRVHGVFPLFLPWWNVVPCPVRTGTPRWYLIASARITKMSAMPAMLRT